MLEPHDVWFGPLEIEVPENVVVVGLDIDLQQIKSLIGDRVQQVIEGHARNDDDLS